MKLLIDMNLSPRWVDLFRNTGIEAVHWSAIGPAQAPDTDIMAFADAGQYMVLPQDLDIGSILAATQESTPSVIQLHTDDASPDAIGPLVLRALHHGAIELEAGALLTVDTERTRLRLLPLQSARTPRTQES